MAKHTNSARLQTAMAIMVSVIAVVVFGSWYLNDQVFLKPQNVFWSAIDRSMQTAFVTQSFGTDSLERAPVIKQVTDFQFKGKLAAKTSVTMVVSADNRVEIETVGTPAQDFLKYNKIQNPDRPTADNTIGVWSVKNGTNTDPAQVFISQLTIPPIIFGYLPANQRASLVKDIKQSKVFDIDWAAVNMLDKINGKKVYTYKVNIKLSSYIPIYIKYLKMIGENDVADTMGNSSSSTLAVKISVNPISRQIVRLESDELPAPVDYYNYDVNMPVSIPDAKITINELQQRLGN
jgi:hypothetical protein